MKRRINDCAFPGTCVACGRRFPEGTDIELTFDGWAHQACPDDPGEFDLNRVCQRCWLVHPERACDR